MPTEFEHLTFGSKSPAASNANAVSYRLPATASRVVGGTEYQVTCYASSSAKVVLGWRVLHADRTPGRWTFYHYNGSPLTDLGSIVSDLHNTIVVGIDADGYVHCAFNHHGDALNYRRSDDPLGTWAGGVTSALSMVGTNESQVSYPNFFASPDGKFYFLFRDGESGNGDVYLYVYDESTTSWAAAPGTGTGGILIDGKESDASPYMNGDPKFSSDWDGAGTGRMHLSWMWRDSAGETTNHDLYHVVWDGTTFTKYDGSSQTVPITQANGDEVVTIATGTGLLNQLDFDLTSAGRPVIAYTNTVTSVSQLFVAYHNGTSWATQQVTSHSAGAMTDWGRPIVVVDRDTDTCHIIGSNPNEHANKVFEWRSDPGDFTSWTRYDFYEDTESVGASEPNYDRRQWQVRKEIHWVYTRGRSAGTTAATRMKFIARTPVGADSGTTFPTGWLRRQPIVIDHTQVGTGGVTDFTTLLTRAHFDNEVCDPNGSNHAQYDGGDLVFTSDAGGNTRLPCDVVRFGLDSDTDEADAEVEIYVKVPSLSDGSPTTIYVWYSHADWQHQPFVTDTYGRFATYPDRRLFMPFSSEQGDRSGDVIFSINQGAPAYAAGKVLDAFSGNGSAAINCGTAAPGVSTAYSLAAWVNLSSAAGDVQFVSGDLGSGTGRCWQFRKAGTGGVPQFIRFNSTPAVIETVAGTTDLRSAGWKRIWATFDTTNGSRLYVDGVQEGTSSDTTANNDAATTPLWVAARPTANFLPASSLLDNAELHTGVSRSAAWVVTDFNNQNDPASFAAAGTPTDAEAEEGTTVTPTTAELTLTTFAPTVTATAHQTATPTTAELSLTTFAPTVTVGTTDNIVVTPDAASLTITTFAPTVGFSGSATPLTLALHITTFRPSVRLSSDAPSTGTMTLLGV